MRPLAAEHFDGDADMTMLSHRVGRRGASVV